MALVAYTPAVKRIINNGQIRRTVPVMITERLHATSTMDLVSLDEKISRHRSIRSTLQIASGERDFSRYRQRVVRGEDERQWNILLNAVSESFQNNKLSVPYITRAEELDLVQAAAMRHSFDKVLLLLNHGEHAPQEIVEDVAIIDPTVDILSKKGVGQTLSLARRTATFCNNDTGLVPDLFLIEPSVAAAQTAFFSFPYETPHCSLSNSRWVCHPAVAGIGTMYHTMIGTKLREVGIDNTMLDDAISITPTAACDLLRNANDLIDWLSNVDEKIVVGTCVPMLYLTLLVVALFFFCSNDVIPFCYSLR
jgi:hypothetical protein